MYFDTVFQKGFNSKTKKYSKLKDTITLSFVPFFVKGKTDFVPNTDSSWSLTHLDCLLACLLATEDMSGQPWESNMHRCSIFSLEGEVLVAFGIAKHENLFLEKHSFSFSPRKGSFMLFAQAGTS